MPFFYDYSSKNLQKTYNKALSLSGFTASWSKWYFFVKYNSRHSALFPKLKSWSYRSLYTNKRHYLKKESSKKMVLMHLFWVLDIWKLSNPMHLKGLSTNFPIQFTCKFFDSLEVYSRLQNWSSFYGLNKDKALPYMVTKSWINYKPYLWMTRSYHYFNYWYLASKKQRLFRRADAKLWFINTWYIENGSYHKLQARFICQVPSTLPIAYTKVLWLRLMQYPCIYNYQWYGLLKHLSVYTNRTVLPWTLMYSSKQTWMFDYRAKGLVMLLKALVRQRTQITEYILVKRWKDLLTGQDAFSKSFQIFIRTSPFLRIYSLDKSETLIKSDD